jgi:hypothetical protein
MIPAAFDYVCATSLDQAIDLLNNDPEGSKLLAGGHTLIPTLKLRLASPSLLIDIRGIARLKGIEIGDDSSIRIGALTTHAELLASEPLHKALPIFREAADVIADPQVRNRGTIGGSLANADPAAGRSQRFEADRREGVLCRYLLDRARAGRSPDSHQHSATAPRHPHDLSKGSTPGERLCDRRRRSKRVSPE